VRWALHTSVTTRISYSSLRCVDGTSIHLWEANPPGMFRRSDALPTVAYIWWESQQQHAMFLMLTFAAGAAGIAGVGCPSVCVCHVLVCSLLPLLLLLLPLLLPPPPCAGSMFATNDPFAHLRSKQPMDPQEGEWVLFMTTLGLQCLVAECFDGYVKLSCWMKQLGVTWAAFVRCWVDCSLNTMVQYSCFHTCGHSAFTQ